MVAKITIGKNLYGALAYNQKKIDRDQGMVLYSNKMTENPAGTFDIHKCMADFENQLPKETKTEKPVIHISVNPHPEDVLTDDRLAEIAHEYMERLGYGNQPYMVYKHEDIDRHHVHIVSLRVDETGKKINDRFEYRRSMDICRELEVKYGLRQVADKKKEQDLPYLKRVEYEKGDVKRQISNVLKTVCGPGGTEAYRFRSFGEYSALLSCFNIEAKAIKGEHEGKSYNGIIYTATDDKGNATGNPFKSSLFGKTFGHDALEKQMKKNAEEFKNGKNPPKIKGAIASAMNNTASKEDFMVRLKASGIEVIFRENGAGRIYGVTFVDHKNREVYNGSRLGKEFSASIFNAMFSRDVSQAGVHDNNMHGEDNRKRAHTHTIQHDDAGFNSSLAAAGSMIIDETFGVFPFEVHGTGPEEEEFRGRMNRKKRKKRRYYGRQF